MNPISVSSQAMPQACWSRDRPPSCALQQWAWDRVVVFPLEVRVVVPQTVKLGHECGKAAWHRFFGDLEAKFSLRSGT